MSQRRLIPFAFLVATLSALPAAAQTNSVAKVETAYMTAHDAFLKVIAEPCIDQQTRDKAIAANRAAEKVAFDNWSAKNGPDKDWKYVNRMVLSLMSEYDAINRVPLCAKAGTKPVLPPNGPSVQPPGEKEVKKACITQADIDAKQLEWAMLKGKADEIEGKIHEKQGERNEIDEAIARLDVYFDKQGHLKPVYVENPDQVPEEYKDISGAAERIDKANQKKVVETEIERLTNEWVPIALQVQRLKEEIERLQEQLKAQDCGPKTATPPPVKPPATKSGRPHDKGKKIPVVLRKEESHLPSYEDNRVPTLEESRTTTRENNRVTTATSRRNEAAEEQQRRATTDALVTGIAIGTSIGMGFGGGHGRHEHAPVERPGFGGDRSSGGGMGFQMR